MNDPHDLIEEETVSRHFDDGNTREETAALGELLARDPETARRFAETARLHALMESISPHAAAVQARRRRFRAGPWLAAAAALIVAGGVAVFILTRPDDSGLTIRASTGEEKTDGPLLPAPPSANVRRVVKQAYGAAAPEGVNLDELMDRWMTNVDPDGKTVKQAIGLVYEEARAINLLRRPEIDGIVYRIEESRIVGEAEPLIHYPYPPPYSLTKFLEICRLYHNIIRIPFTEVPQRKVMFDPKDEGVVQAWSLAPSPDFHSSMKGMAGKGVPADPAVWLRELGMPLLPSESVRFSPSTGALRFTATLEKRNRLAEVLQVMSMPSSRFQYFLNSRYEVVPSELLPAGFDPSSGSILTPAEFEGFLEKFQARGAVAPHGMPSSIVRNGQSYKVEMTRELSGGKTGWTGFQQEARCQSVGELITVTGHTDLGVPPGTDFDQDLRALLSGQLPASAASIHHITDFELWLPDGHTGLFALACPTSPGFVALAMITATVIDPAGMPVSENASGQKPGLPKGIPVEGKPGFLLSPYAPEKGYVDVTGIPPGTKVACPFSGKKFTVPGPADYQILPEETPNNTPASELPLGIPVPEKPGYLLSPYAPDKGYIDAGRAPAGAKVECPYTRKLFRLP